MSSVSNSVQFGNAASAANDPSFANEAKRLSAQSTTPVDTSLPAANAATFDAPQYSALKDVYNGQQASIRDQLTFWRIFWDNVNGQPEHEQPDF